MLCPQTGCCMYQRHKYTCCVCLEHTNQLTECMHELCASCEQRLGIKKCPLCRQNFNYVWEVESAAIKLDCTECGLMTPFVAEDGRKLCRECGSGTTLHLEFDFGELYARWARRFKDPRWLGSKFWDGVKLTEEQRFRVRCLSKYDSRDFMRRQTWLAQGKPKQDVLIVID